MTCKGGRPVGGQPFILLFYAFLLLATTGGGHCLALRGLGASTSLPVFTASLSSQSATGLRQLCFCPLSMPRTGLNWCRLFFSGFGLPLDPITASPFGSSFSLPYGQSKSSEENPMSLRRSKPFFSPSALLQLFPSSRRTANTCWAANNFGRLAKAEAADAKYGWLPLQLHTLLGALGHCPFAVGQLTNQWGQIDAFEATLTMLLFIPVLSD